MKIIESILTNNPCYKAGRKITVKGLMIHSVGTPQPSAKVFVTNWNKSTYTRACVHAFIDANTGDVYQCLPWNHRGWHGGGSSNNTHIGVEMCEPSTIKYTGGSSFVDNDPVKTKEAVMRTYQSAVELFAMLCKKYNLDPLKNIVSHREGYNLGIATNHGDPEHIWKKYGLSIDGFRKDVQKTLQKTENKTTDNVSDAKGTISQGTVKKASEVAKSLLKGIAGSYTVTASALNVRTGAGTDKAIMVAIPKGTVVQCYGYYTEVSGIKWYYVQFTYNNVTYTGFCSSAYLSRK